MKKIIRKIFWRFRRRRIRSVFEKWYVFYLNKGLNPCVAEGYANRALLYLVPEFIFYEDYLDFAMQEYCGLPPSRESMDGDKRVEQKSFRQKNKMVDTQSEFR